MEMNSPVLEGQHVRLEPLTFSHAGAFYEATREWSLSREAVNAGIESALREQQLGSTIAFATVDKRSAQVVGGTRYLVFALSIDVLKLVRAGSRNRSGELQSTLKRSS